MLLCKICIARRLVVDIFPWCNAHYVPFPSETLVARRMGNGSISQAFKGGGEVQNKTEIQYKCEC